MAGYGPDIGTGATITYGSSAGWYAYFADSLTKVRSIDVSGVSRAAVETTGLDTTPGRTFIAGDIYDPGEITIELALDAELAHEAAGGSADTAANDGLITDAVETLTITFPVHPSVGTGTGPKFAASAFCTGYSFGVQIEEVVIMSVTFKLTGAIQWTDHS